MVSLYLYEYPGHSSLLDRRTLKHRDSLEISAVTFNSLCEEFSIKEIEYLCIDTEGLDYEIINSIDTYKIDIKVIVFEKWNMDNDDLNDTYRTGLDFLNKIALKFKNYKCKFFIGN